MKRVAKKTENKKVRNATPVTIDGIKFRSKLEAYTYKLLQDNNIPIQYEVHKFELVPKFVFRGEIVRPMTYTPDFVGEDFIIECKGNPNDVFPYKWKLFKHYLYQQNISDKYALYLIRNQKQAKELVANLINKT